MAVTVRVSGSQRSRGAMNRNGRRKKKKKEEEAKQTDVERVWNVLEKLQNKKMSGEKRKIQKEKGEVK